MLKFPHSEDAYLAVLDHTRAGSQMWTEYVIQIYDDLRPLILLVPSWQITAPSSIRHNIISSIGREFYPWCMEEIWGGPTTFLPFTDRPHLPDAHPIVISQLTYMPYYHTSTVSHVLRVTDVALAIGDFVTLHCIPEAHTPLAEAKLVGIRVMEQKWFELCLQVHPADISSIGRRLLHLVVPFTHLKLTPDITKLYHTHYDLLSTTLEESILPIPNQWNKCPF